MLFTDHNGKNSLWLKKEAKPLTLNSDGGGSCCAVILHLSPKLTPKFRNVYSD